MVLHANLRNVQNGDLEKLFYWRNRLFIRSVMFNTKIIEWDQHIAWYNSITLSDNKCTKIFSIKDVDYGVVSLIDIEKNNKCAWGFYIGNEFAPKGTGLLLGYTALEYIFVELNMRKLCAEIIESNIVSQKFHEKLGFKLDGILRKHIERDEHHEDVYVYSLFNEEWKQKSIEIKAQLEERFI